MSKSLKKLIDINGLREFKNKLVGTDSAYVQTAAVDQTIAGTKTFSNPIAGSVTGSSGSCTGNAATATRANSAASADTATNATYTNWLRTSSHSDHLFHTEWDGGYFWTYVTAGDGGYRPVRVARSDSATTAEACTGNAATATRANSAASADTATNATNATNSNAANQLQAFVNDDFTGGNHYVKAIRSSYGWSTHLWMCYNNGAKMADEVSVNYANSAGSATKADTATKATQDSDGNQINTTYSKNGHTHSYIPTSASCNKNWNWSGLGGQPTWLWGGEDGTNMYVYNPSNFSVNYANSAGYAETAANGVDSQDANWIRFKNGVQICWGGASTSGFAFPKPFTAAPAVSLIHQTIANRKVLINVSDMDNRNCHYNAYDVEGRTYIDASVLYIAFGYWSR